MSKSIRSISFGAILSLAIFFTTSAFALEPTDKWEGLIDYAATGATLLDDQCTLTYDATTDKQSCIPLASANGDRDFQGDTALTESESFLGGIPNDVHIVKATLIWIGSVNPVGGTIDTQVTLTPPGGTGYTVFAGPGNLQEKTLRNQDANTGEIQNWHYYTNRVDVTEFMQTHHVTEGGDLNGYYKFSDYQGYAGAPYIWNTMAMGGWSLIIVYSSPTANPKRIFYYTNFDYTSNNQLVQNPSGFQVPEDAEAKVTLFISEGDYPLWGMCYGMEDMNSPTLNTGDFTGTPAEICSDYLGINYTEGLFFNGEILDDGCFPDAPSQEITTGLYTPTGPNSENVYNSTVNTNLHPSEGACRINTYSIDLDTFDVSNYLNFGDTEANVTMSLGSDFIFTNYIILSIDTKLPDFDIPGEPEKRASVPTGESLYPGQEFTYYIDVQNNGEDVAVNVKVKDDLPSQVHYVPDSTYVVDPNGTRTHVPDPASGVPPCYTGIPISDSMNPDPSKRYTVEIGVKLKTLAEGITKETIIDNVAEIIAGDGDVYFTNGGIPASHSVKIESYEGELNFSKGSKNPESRFVSPGDSNVLAAHIVMSALDGDVQLSAMTFTPVANTEPLVIESAQLYLDKGNDGAKSPTDILIGESSWESNGLVFNDFSALPQVDKDSVASLLLIVKIADNATPGLISQLELTADKLSIRGFSKGLPFKAAKLYIPAEDTDLSVEFGLLNPPDSYVTAGDTAIAAQIMFKSYTAGTTIESITIGSEGTVYEPNEVVEISMYSDIDANGVVSGSDQQLGTTINPGSDDPNLTFSGINMVLNSGEYMNVIVSVKFAEDAGSEKTFRLTLNNAEQIVAGTANILGTPLEGSLFTIADTVEGCLDDNECLNSYGYGWYCDQLAGICKDGNSGTDGDVDGDAITDGDTDGNGGGSSADGSGGCLTIANNNAALFFIALLVMFVALRRRRVK